MRKLITLALAALTLSGCFEASQDFWFGEDGTAKFNMRMAMDASFVAMTETDGDPFCGDNYAEAAGKRDIIVSSERSTSESDAVCEISMEGKTQS